jgi:WD40 repeat protein
VGKLQRTFVLGLAFGMARAETSLTAQQPLAENQAQTSEQPRKQHEQAARTDRYGDPLPEGVLARLGITRLRAVGAQVGISSDGKTIIAVTRGRQVKVWDAVTGRLREKRELPIQLSDEAHLSADGRLLAVRGPDADGLQIWDIPAGKRLHLFPTAYRIAFSPDGKTLAQAERARAGKSIIRLCDIESGEQRELQGPARTPESLTFSPDGRLLAAACDFDIICWNIAKGKQL